MIGLRNNPVVVLSLLAAVIAAWVFTTFAGLSINVETDRVWATFAVLMFVALVIERATEVYIEPQSNPRSAALKTELAAIRDKKDELLKAIPEAANNPDVDTLPPELVELTATETARSQELAVIDKETQAKALGITIPLSLLVALAGVRVLGGLMPDVEIADATHAYGLATADKLYLDYYQYCLLSVVDVVLTAGLLAGGADGVHKILDRFLKLAANRPT